MNAQSAGDRFDRAASAHAGPGADPRYVKWLAAVDRGIEFIAGVSLWDLPDTASYDAWEAGENPQEYARQVLRDEGFPLDD